ncbi:hypothetical protein TWF481_011028 [Arthrobotrys musiformis]|uniref:Uncharacterized protein n=1 Tax=Arthrobotrys musiformis TaxID=47236 RepID=A0AAV9VYJ1_9PEZI
MAGYNKQIKLVIVRSGPDVSKHVPSTVKLPPSLVLETAYETTLGATLSTISNQYEALISAEEGELQYYGKYLDPIEPDERLGDSGAVLQELDSSMDGKTVKVYAFGGGICRHWRQYIPEPDSMEPDVSPAQDRYQ